MADRICTRFKDDDGLDIGCHLVTREYLFEAYFGLAPFLRIPRTVPPGMWLWGEGIDGKLGDDTEISKSSPIQTVSGGTDWKSVSLGSCHSAAIKTDGTLWLWGSNLNGILGINQDFSVVASQSIPVQTVSGGTDWKSVSLGFCHSAAIKTDGTLWLWGSNVNGRLGTDDVASRSSPVQTVSGGTDWKSVSLGCAHSAAIKTDGTLWLWAFGGSGRLGTEDVANRSSPVQTVSGGTDWQSVSLGDEHSAAIKTDGTLWLWGCGSVGRLGNGISFDRSSPVQTVSGGTDWKSVSLGCAHSAAIKTDGTLWLWGTNGVGQLGTNHVFRRSSPVQTVSGGTNWKSVSLGSYHSAAIKTDGTLWLWGCDGSGRLGINLDGNRSSPVQTVSVGTEWRSVSLGCSHSAAISSEGEEE